MLKLILEEKWSSAMSFACLWRFEFIAIHLHISLFEWWEWLQHLQSFLPPVNVVSLFLLLSLGSVSFFLLWFVWATVPCATVASKDVRLHGAEPPWVSGCIHSHFVVPDSMIVKHHFLERWYYLFMTHLTMLPSSLGELIMKIVLILRKRNSIGCEDGYRKMADEETVYVTVLLQTVWFDEV